MKVFDFKCKDCNNVEERYIKASVDSTTQKCSKCGGWMSKIFSAPAMLKTNCADKTWVRGK